MTSALTRLIAAASTYALGVLVGALLGFFVIGASVAWAPPDHAEGHPADSHVLGMLVGAPFGGVLGFLWVRRSRRRTFVAGPPTGIRMAVRTTDALQVAAVCPACATATTYPIFEGGACDVETLQGRRTGELYRVDADVVKYGVATREQILAPILVREGSLGFRRLPEEVLCPGCGIEFSAKADAYAGAAIDVPAIFISHR
jgi:hypothetical protein